MTVRLRSGELGFDIDATVVIGREGDVVIADPRSSRRHAEVRIIATGVHLIDLGSANGTFVNGERLTQPVAVPFGGRFIIGDTEFIVEAVPTPAAVAAPIDPNGTSVSPPAPRPGPAASPGALVSVTGVLDPSATLFADGSVLEVAAVAPASAAPAKERVPVQFPSVPTLRIPTVHGEIQIPTSFVPTPTKSKVNVMFVGGLAVWIILLIVLAILAVNATP